MAPWIIPAIGAGIGLFGGAAGADTRRQVPNSEAGATSSNNVSSMIPPEQLNDIFGYLSGTGNQMGRTPVPYFPGQTYIGPSSATQAGINMGMGSLPWYQQASGAMGNAAGLYGQQSGYYQQAAPAFKDAGDAYGNVSSAYNAAAPWQQYAGNKYLGAGQGYDALQPGYNQSGQLFQSLNPMYQQSGNAYGQAGQQMAGTGAQYGMAGGIGNSGLGLYGMGAGQALGAQPGMQGLLGAAGQNYGQLSTATDVGNNPHVQAMMDRNAATTTKGFLENVLPKMDSGAIASGGLGSSRANLAQGQAAGDTAEALSNTNAQILLDSYGKGLGAQQAALGQTGNMLNNMMMPAKSSAWAAQQSGDAMRQASAAGDLFQRQAMVPAQVAALLGQQADQYGRGAEMFGRGMDQRQTGANMGRMGADLAGQGADRYRMGADTLNLGANALGQRANQYRMGADTWGLGADAMGRMGQAYGQGGDYLNKGAQSALGYGQTVEGYQGAALEDAMNRFSHQYQEPLQRAQMLQQLLSAFAGQGTQYNNSTGQTRESGMQNNPNYQSRFGGGLQGALSGGMMGYGLSKPIGNWWDNRGYVPGMTNADGSPYRDDANNFRKWD